jgi:GDP-L-fucose synthase
MNLLKSQGYDNIVTRTHLELDLTCQGDVESFFAEERPEYVFISAARVGGIYFHQRFPADIIRDNSLIELNIIKSAFDRDAKKLLLIGSTAVYPRDIGQPLKEDCILSGMLEPSQEPYALSKILGIKLCEFFNEQYGTDFISVLPVNVYGSGDKDDLQNAHVIAALIRKFSEAVFCCSDTVTVWGTGQARREFIHADDLADACLFLMNNYSGNEPVNIGTGKDISICELVALLKEISGFKGKIVWDTSKPDGVLRRQSDCSKLLNMGWRPRISLERGICELYANYKKSRIEKR